MFWGTWNIVSILWGMKEIRLFKLRQWILQYIKWFFSGFLILAGPLQPKELHFAFCLAVPRENWQSCIFSWNTAISLQMKWCTVPALQQQHIEWLVSGKGEVPSRFSCKHAWLGLALLCFAPPSHSLTVCAGCENCHCTSWSRSKFYMGSKMLVLTTWIILQLCCSMTIAIPSLTWLHLTNKALCCSCNQELSIGSWSHLSPAWLVSSPTLLSVGYLKFLLRVLCHLSEVALALMG